MGLLDRQTKLSLQGVSVNTLVVTLFGAGAREEQDALGWERHENSLHCLDRIALTGVTACVQSGVIEAIRRLALYQLCSSDGLIGVGEPEA